MIKKFSNTDYNDDTNYKYIVHTINKLYKIKYIDRKVDYIDNVLRNMVLDHKIGRQVIAELKEYGVTRTMLLNYGLHFFNRVLGVEFPYN